MPSPRYAAAASRFRFAPSLLSFATLLLASAGIFRGGIARTPAAVVIPRRPQGIPRTAPSGRTYLGFDRNDYPGDPALNSLRQTFSFTGYWLNNPPGEVSNSWHGKREILRSHGFGFLVVFNGRPFKGLQRLPDLAALGASDAAAAVAAARSEQFPAGTVIFLDQEEGGRLLPEQRAYLYAWVDGVNTKGFRACVYCSGVPFRESPGDTVVTANDIRDFASDRKIVYWIYNDACPPSPGCAPAINPPAPSNSGVPFAFVWQFAQSPRRSDVARGCPANYDPDGNCYVPGRAGLNELHLDLDSADSPDPSHGS